METQESLQQGADSGLLADFWDRAGLAKELRCTVRTLQRMLGLPNPPPSIKIAGRRLFRKASITRWLAERETTTPIARSGGRRRVR